MQTSTAYYLSEIRENEKKTESQQNIQSNRNFYFFTGMIKMKCLNFHGQTDKIAYDNQEIISCAPLGF